MGNDSRILIMDCPTRGIDIGVKESIYKLMMQFKREGRSMIMISEELPELNVPILVQACDDDFDKLDMANRRDAFCGKIFVCNNLYRGVFPTAPPACTPAALTICRS